MTVTGAGGKASEQSTFVRRDADGYDGTDGCALIGFARRLRYGNGRRSRAVYRAPVCAILATMSIRSLGVGVQLDLFVVGRVIGLLDCEVSPKYGRSVGLCGYSGLSVDLACDGAVLPDLYGLAVEWTPGTAGFPSTIQQGRCFSCWVTRLTGLLADTFSTVSVAIQ